LGNKRSFQYGKIGMTRAIIRAIHFSQEKDFKVQEIHIKNPNMKDEGYWCKPIGGIWASPVHSDFGWKEWLSENSSFSDRIKFDKLIPVELDVDISKFIIINNPKDLDKLSWYKFLPDDPISRIENIDFEKMKREGVEGIFLTEQGQKSTWMPYIQTGSFRNLYGWDCESLLIMNERCILSTKIVEKEKLQDMAARHGCKTC
jgi:hypothetical protein